MKRVQKTARDLQQSLGRDATPGEIAEKLGDKTEEDVKNIINYLQSPVSLETLSGTTGRTVWEIWWKTERSLLRRRR